MPRVARACIETAKSRAMHGQGTDGAMIPSPAQVWDMITRTNADALGWHDSGRLEVGAWADLLVLRVPELWMDEHLVGRLIYNWSPDLIESRVFAGIEVDPARVTL
jgi:cytosine/adenosine deaminase-related metal-dependent hydrolase